MYLNRRSHSGRERSYESHAKHAGRIEGGQCVFDSDKDWRGGGRGGGRQEHEEVKGKRGKVWSGEP